MPPVVAAAVIGGVATVASSSIQSSAQARATSAQLESNEKARLRAVEDLTRAGIAFDSLSNDAIDILEGNNEEAQFLDTRTVDSAAVFDESLKEGLLVADQNLARSGLLGSSAGQRQRGAVITNAAERRSNILLKQRELDQRDAAHNQAERALRHNRATTLAAAKERRASTLADIIGRGGDLSLGGTGNLLRGTV